MNIQLTDKESEEYFYNSLCNAVATGYMAGYGLRLDFEDADYAAAKKTLKDKGDSPCMEDIWMQILREGKKLTFTDIEGEGENTRSVTLEDVHKKVALTPLNHLTDMVNENDDAVTADVILQTVFFDSIIFG